VCRAHFVLRLFVRARSKQRCDALRMPLLSRTDQRSPFILSREGGDSQSQGFSVRGRTRHYGEDLQKRYKGVSGFAADSNQNQSAEGSAVSGSRWRGAWHDVIQPPQDLFINDHSRRGVARQPLEPYLFPWDTFI
jgi:hypothetical protein